MKNRQRTSFLLLLTIIFSGCACVKRARNQLPATANEPQSLATATPATSSTQQQPRRININTAPANELETLPGIGKGLAGRIIEHREKYGPFRRAEHLIIVRGISDKRFQAVRDLITVE